MTWIYWICVYKQALLWGLKQNKRWTLQPLHMHYVPVGGGIGSFCPPREYFVLQPVCCLSVLFCVHGESECKRRDVCSGAFNKGPGHFVCMWDCVLWCDEFRYYLSSFALMKKRYLFLFIRKFYWAKAISEKQARCGFVCFVKPRLSACFKLFSQLVLVHYIWEKMSTDCQKTTAKAIPSTRRVTINDAAHMPHDYSTTPGGTLFSTTPGGTNCCYTSY